MEERDGSETITGGFNDVTHGSLVERNKGDLEEIAGAKSDDCEGSIRTDTFMDRTDGLVVNQHLCLDESKREEPLSLNFPDIMAGDSKEVRNCSKLEGVSSFRPEMIIYRSFLSSSCDTSDEHKELDNPDEPHILTNMERSLYFGDEVEDKKPDAKALDKTITQYNSTDIKKEDYVARLDVNDTNFSVQKDGQKQWNLRKMF